MPCACDRCIEHAGTLALESRPISKEAIHKSFREQAKLWHPDKVENFPNLRASAEEHFKRVQVAYRELIEHEARPVVAPEEVFRYEPVNHEHEPYPAAIDFGNAPGCYAFPNIPKKMEDMALRHLPQGETVLAILNLRHTGEEGEILNRFMILASNGIILKDTFSGFSLLRYDQLGEIKFNDRRVNGKLPLSARFHQWLSGIEENFELEIYRRDQTLFCAPLAGQIDDSVQKVLYNFLLRKKYQTAQRSY
jgi:DnaJ-like protein